MAECTIYDKLRYIQETKDLIKAAIESQDVEVLESSTFRQYADYITQIRKVSSVNGMQGDVTITLEDLGGITREELDEAISSVDVTDQLQDYVRQDNLKSINGESILGEGNITIEGGGTDVIELTQSEYDELERNGQLEDSLYLITDVVSDYITQDELSIQLQDKVSETSLNEAIEGVRNEIPNTDSFITQEQLDEAISSVDVTDQLQDYVKQDNLKTINGESILGEGNITIEGGEGGGTDVIEITQSEYDELENNGRLQDSLYVITDVTHDYVTQDELSIQLQDYVKQDNLKTINGESLIGEGNITIEGGGTDVIELTQSEYDNLEEKVEGTLYVITDAQEITVPTKLSQLENDSNYVTQDYLNEIIGGVENKITQINELI